MAAFALLPDCHDLNSGGIIVPAESCPAWQFHRLYALDLMLPDLHQPAKADLEKAMQGHILAQCELVGCYQKGGGRI